MNARKPCSSSRKLFLHIGPHKTGTSAVQHAMRDYDGADLNYPKVGLWADGSHHNLVFNFFGDFRRPEVMRGDLSEWFRIIGEQAAGNCGHLLISSEALVKYNLERLIVRLLACTPPGESWEAEILVVCRDHFERAASSYNQSVKDAFEMLKSEPNDYLIHAAPGLCYGPLLRNLQSTGYRVSALSYHPAATFLHRFLRHVGLENPTAIQNVQRNVSLSLMGLIATLAANRVAATPDDRVRYSKELRRIRPLYASSGKIFGRRAILEADQLFRPDREFLAQEFNINLPALDADFTEGTFSINESQFREIESALQSLGDEGAAIVQAVRSFTIGTSV